MSGVRVGGGWTGWEGSSVGIVHQDSVSFLYRDNDLFLAAEALEPSCITAPIVAMLSQGSGAPRRGNQPGGAVCLYVFCVLGLLSLSS